MHIHHFIMCGNVLCMCRVCVHTCAMVLCAAGSYSHPDLRAVPYVAFQHFVCGPRSHSTAVNTICRCSFLLIPDMHPHIITRNCKKILLYGSSLAELAMVSRQLKGLSEAFHYTNQWHMYSAFNMYWFQLYYICIIIIHACAIVMQHAHM